ncbi:hypothetical protein [Sphingosinicella sp. BN140058]|uniref:hypothetical protein n=1 Tax=Sphingosinicella sp. BN140058 TaxID=1892855 RepID=UPI001012F753|nr:hypothetical protein [Sphingosinicella sp. BN140058]QAY78087.1 hypothetical protein ETR14_17330 [Sphingosinicella sp. BN140058]
MHILALIEIRRDPDGGLPADLLRLAYRASRRGRILLVLHDVSAAEIDAELDALVREMPLDIPGLLYLRATDIGSLAEASSGASMIFVSNETQTYWRSALLGRRAMGEPDRASEVLCRIARPACLADLAVRTRRPRRNSGPGATSFHI